VANNDLPVFEPDTMIVTNGPVRNGQDRLRALVTDRHSQE
jgi:predicted GTPase